MKYFFPGYKPYRQSIKWGLLASLFLNVLSGHSLQAETDEAVTVLPSMTVFSTRGEDNTSPQRVEVEWHLSNDPTITRDIDGAYTAAGTTKPYSLKSLLMSLGSPAVNFDISYAKNSVSMTADGRLVLTTLVDTLGHLDEGTTIHITPINKSTQENTSVTQRRVDSLRQTLLRDKGVNVKFIPSKALKSTSSAPKKNNYWRIQIQRNSL